MRVVTFLVLFLLLSSILICSITASSSSRTVTIDVEEDENRYDPLAIFIIVLIALLALAVIVFGIIFLIRKLLYSKEPPPKKICPRCFEVMVLKKKEYVCERCGQPGVRI